MTCRAPSWRTTPSDATLVHPTYYFWHILYLPCTISDMSGAAATSTSAVRTGRRPGAAPEEPLELDAATALIQLSRIVQCVHADLSEQHGLTPVQAKLLCVLATSPRQMAELARGFGVEKAALTGLVDRAERRGPGRPATP